jgi:hypothetical protein
MKFFTLISLIAAIPLALAIPNVADSDVEAAQDPAAPPLPHSVISTPPPEDEGQNNQDRCNRPCWQLHMTCEKVCIILPYTLLNAHMQLTLHKGEA